MKLNIITLFLVSNGPFSAASVVEKSNQELSVVPIPYTYTYGKTPQGCCYGYYDDPKLDIFNRAGNIPTAISRTDGVQWGPVTHDYELVADLGNTHSITQLKVCYIVNSGWSKYAPKSITMKGKLSKDSDWTYESTISQGFATGRGGHSVSWPVSNWGNVQYIQLSAVIPSQAQSVMSRLVVYGNEVSHQPTKLSSTPSAAPTPGEDVCEKLDKKKCKKLKDSCVFGKSKIYGICAPKKEKWKHDCAQYQTPTDCSGKESGGFCTMTNDGVCTHICGEDLEKKACAKVRNTLDNKKNCKMPKIKNPCNGCRSVSEC